MNTGINWAFAAIFLGSPIVLYRMCRRPRPSLQQRVAQAETRTAAVPYPEPASPPSAPDTRRRSAIPSGPDARPGTDAAALDWLELTYAMPDFDAATDRLQAAIDDQQDGDVR